MFSKKNNKKGQLTLNNVIFLTIMIISYILVIIPVLNGVISAVGLTGIDAMIASLFPLVLLLMIAVRLYVYSQPQRTQGYQ